MIKIVSLTKGLVIAPKSFIGYGYNKMRCGITKALKERAHNITIGNHKGQTEQNIWQSNMKDIALRNLIRRYKSSRTRLMIHQVKKETHVG